LHYPKTLPKAPAYSSTGITARGAMAIEFHFRKGVFAIEDWYGPFEGWTADQHWNGWACPYFERDVALRIAAAWNEVTFEKDVFKAHYDEEHDQFCSIQSLERTGSASAHRSLMWKAGRSSSMRLAHVTGSGRKLYQGECRLLPDCIGYGSQFAYHQPCFASESLLDQSKFFTA
jgi:hypothetical protein